jgi:hypothetical protein
MTAHTQQRIELTKRQQRENELMALLSSPTGRSQLTVLLRQCLNIPSGQIPIGTPIVQTILSHEAAKPDASPSA